MKYILIVIMCGYVDKFCADPVSFADVYNDWSKCMVAGMEKSIQFSNSLDTNFINENLIFFKYYCQNIA